MNVNLKMVGVQTSVSIWRETSRLHVMTVLFISDVNECKFNNGGCSDICINLAGNVTCVCHDGFGLQDDGKTCSGEQ